MDKVISMLKTAGMPKDYGLCQGGLFIIHLKNNNVNQACEELIITMLRFTYRDQALLSYIFWKRGEKVNAMFTKDFYHVSGKMGNHIYV